METEISSGKLAHMYQSTIQESLVNNILPKKNKVKLLKHVCIREKKLWII
jgi:hypothetical protein